MYTGATYSMLTLRQLALFTSSSKARNASHSLTLALTITGYFAVNHTRMGPAQDLFGQLWKEYALSDSRYLTSDPFVLCMETITAVRFSRILCSMAFD